MSDPLFKQQRNKRTGEVRDLMSHDGGQSWMVVPSTQEAPNEPAAPQQPLSSMDMVMELGERALRAGKGAISSAGESLYDGAMGAAQGVTMGGADELAGMLPGTSMQEQQALTRQAQQRSPWAYGLGNAAGAAVPAMVSGGATALEQLAMSALQGGAAGFLGNDGDMQQRAGSGLVGAGVGAAVTGGAQGIGKLAPMLGRAADSERAAAFSTPGDFATLARKEGLDYSQHELAQQAERMGLTNKVIPQSAASYAQRAGAARQTAGAAYGQALDDAGAQNAHGYADPIADGLQAIQRQGMGNRSSLGAPRAAVATDLLDRLGPTGQQMSPRELWALKKEYEAAGGYVADDIKNLPTGQGPLVNQEAAGLARGELDNAMGLALPETQGAYDAARRDHGFAATIENLANEKAIQDAKPLGMLPAIGWAGGGGALGGLPGAAAGYVAGKGMRTYGHDAAANALRGAEGFASGMGGMAPGFGRGAGVGAGDAVAWLANSKSEREQQAISTMEQARGQHFTRAVEEALDTAPQMLGQYRQQLEEARASGDPARFNAAISALNQDPEFRQRVRQPLLQRTGGMR